MGSYVNGRFRLFDRAALGFQTTNRSNGINKNSEISTLADIIETLVWNPSNFEQIKALFPNATEEIVVAKILKDYCDYYAAHDSEEAGYRKELAVRAIEKAYWRRARNIVKLFLKKMV